MSNSHDFLLARGLTQELNALPEAFQVRTSLKNVAEPPKGAVKDSHKSKAGVSPRIYSRTHTDAPRTSASR